MSKLVTKRLENRIERYIFSNKKEKKGNVK
jgi:hypothetical protein